MGRRQGGREEVNERTSAERQNSSLRSGSFYSHEFLALRECIHVECNRRRCDLRVDKRG
jgi:hypothetical protein